MGDLKRSPIFFHGSGYKNTECRAHGRIGFIGLGNFLQVLSECVNWILSERAVSLRQPPHTSRSDVGVRNTEGSRDENTNGQKGASSMKKFDKNDAQRPTDASHLKLVRLGEASGRDTNIRVRKPRRSVPINQIFTIAPGVDTLTLLHQASETLASLNAVIANFAHKLDGSNRAMLGAIQQLAGIAQLLVNQARDNLDPGNDTPDDHSPTRH
jgi:hypothetical protein